MLQCYPTTRFNGPCALKPAQQPALAGQSLMEFVLVMPILVLILIGGFSFGVGTYEAHMASDGIQLPSTHKLEMAKLSSAVGAGNLTGYVSSGGTTGSMMFGPLLDTVSVTPIDKYTSLMVGQKSFVPQASFIPGFTIKTAQVMNGGLLDAANTGGATVRPAGTAWVPGGTPAMPPWLAATSTTTTTTTTDPVTGATVTTSVDTATGITTVTSTDPTTGVITTSVTDPATGITTTTAKDPTTGVTTTTSTGGTTTASATP